jgi:hypothetical protein
MNWRYRFLLFGILLFFRPPAPALAQAPCLGITPGLGLSFDDRVICTVPQLYGPQGLLFISPPFSVGPLQTTAASVAGNFIPASQTSLLAAVNQTITSQIASLPLVAPAAGLSLVFDQSLGVYVASNDSFGPIFSERASTIGKYRLALGFSYQRMNFDSLDGVDLHSFPTLFVQPDDAFAVPPSTGKCNPVTNNPTCSRGSHDYLTASNRIDLNISQYTAYATFGLTNRIDVSVAVPVLTVDMRAAADTSIVPNSSLPGELSFVESPTHGSCTAHSPIGNSQYCSEALFSNSQRSSGLGDLTVRVKGILKSWERESLAAGLDIRVPTGNELNFLGTGAIGIRPFLVWSYRGRLSPHVNLGYQWNGRSILANDIRSGAYVGDTSRFYLPQEAFYSVGLEAALTKRFTATIDLVGQTVMNGERVHLIQALAPGLCPSTSNSPFDLCVNAGPTVQQETIAAYKATYAIDNASLGVRYRPFGRFLVSANVLLKLDNGGLRSKAIPTISATYTFH